MSELSIRHLCAKNKNSSVKDFNLEVPSGQMLVFFYTDGAKQTAIFDAIKGNVPIDEGEVFIGDRLINAVKPKDRRVILLSEIVANLNKGQKVSQCLKKIAKKQLMPRVSTENRILELARAFDFTHLLETPVKSLQPIQRYRVALACALMARASVILIDTDSSLPDAHMREVCYEDVLKLLSNFEITVIYGTDNAEEVRLFNCRTYYFVAREFYMARDGLCEY